MRFQVRANSQQKVWKEAENRERYWGETPHILRHDFFTDFEKKTTVLQSTIVPLTIGRCINKKEEKMGVRRGCESPLNPPQGIPFDCIPLTWAMETLLKAPFQ